MIKRQYFDIQNLLYIILTFVESLLMVDASERNDSAILANDDIQSKVEDKKYKK